MSARFATTVAFGIAGYLGGTVATDWMRSNVVDIGMRGGDAAYALIASLVAVALPLPKKYTTPLATGMMISGGTVALQEYNVI